MLSTTARDRISSSSVMKNLRWGECGCGVTKKVKSRDKFLENASFNVYLQQNSFERHWKLWKEIKNAKKKSLVLRIIMSGLKVDFGGQILHDFPGKSFHNTRKFWNFENFSI